MFTVALLRTHRMIWCMCTNTHTQPFYGPFPRTTWVSRCQKKFCLGFMVQGKITEADTLTMRNRCHSIQTNQRPTSIIPLFVRRIPFLPQPSHFILAWDRHQICWLAYPVEWFVCACVCICTKYWQIENCALI